jgi:hypothetical protein
MKKTLYASAMLFLPLIMKAQTTTSWLLKGNKGTNPAVNFVGTKDSAQLVFRVNNQPSGYIDFDPSTATTAFGYQSLLKNSSVNNTAFGYRTLAANTIGQYNTSVGSYSLSLNTTGLGNTAVGALVLVQNTTGSFNTAIGENALIGNTTGEANVGVGNQTLVQNKTGTDNVAVGSLALYFNTGSFNTALGSNALYDNMTGHDNAATGLYSLYRNTSGNNNTATGNGAMFNNLDGNNNTAVGNSALYLPLHGNNCTALGYNANVAFENLTNATVIGYNAVVDASNKVRIGNAAVTSIGGQVGWTNFSDGRIKKDIKEDVPGLTFIKALRPVTYHFNVAKEYELLNIKDTSNWKGKYDIEKVNFTGLVAQEVDAAAKKINYDFSGIDKTGKILGLRYSEFVVPLIKAVQELSAENAGLKSRLDKIEAMLSAQTQTQNITAINARVEQNIPNPFTSETAIRYYLPAKTQNAYINFYGMAGTLLKSVKLTSTGSGNLTIKSGELPKGAIKYSMVVDGMIADTKEMMH